MILSKEEICRWDNTSDSKRNFKEGERIINADHIIFYRKNIDFNGINRKSYPLQIHELMKNFLLINHNTMLHFS